MKNLFFTGFGMMLTALATIASAPPAQARCFPAQETGTWINVAPGSQDLTKLVIMRRGICGPTDAYTRKFPDWYVEATGSCAALFECSWGRVGAEQTGFQFQQFPSDPPDFSVRVYPIFAAYDRGESQTFLYIYMSHESAENIYSSPEKEDRLIVRAYTGDPDEAQPDTVEQFEFRRLEPRQYQAGAATIMRR